MKHLILFLLLSIQFNANADIVIILDKPVKKYIPPTVTIDFTDDEAGVITGRREIEADSGPSNEVSESVQDSPSVNQISRVHIPHGSFENNRFVDDSMVRRGDRSGKTIDELKQEAKEKVRLMSIKAADEAAQDLKNFREGLQNQIVNELNESVAEGQNPGLDHLLVPITNGQADQVIYDMLQPSLIFSDILDYENQLGIQVNPNERPLVSDHAEQLSGLKQRLDQANPKHGYQKLAKSEAYKNIYNADDLYVNKKQELADVALKVAEILTDIATDLFPPTSITKDLIKVTAGFDPLTGEALDVSDRFIAAGFAVVGVMTGGLSNVAKTGVREALTIVKQITKDAEITVEALHTVNSALKKEKILTEQVANNVFKDTGTKIFELYTGNRSKPIAVIGQQTKRVEKVIQSLKDQGKTVRGFEQTTKAGTQFEDLKKRFGKLDSDQVKQTMSYIENETWITRNLEADHTIISLEPIEHPSDFYNMEKRKVLEKLKDELERNLK